MPLHCVASFQVKNNGETTVIINLVNPPLVVTVRPGEASPPFSSRGTYIIHAEHETLPLPPPQIDITFTPGDLFVAKSINGPSLKVEIVAKLDFPNGDLLSSLSPVENAHHL
ncbi:uncharacterized protein LACBIDRAFT_334603 [Laccaria bicolor S238N-H82]|uniref:Predicted protein n=1 Tax=Laccaria bicolor (strain S238N-H82 / ATCC MYA-4686) TaxID=486041 RepID=B0DZP5_LACBS|nr:uncharacterized protein LACBIDRAFT_334603 [Laccaria bicolor S238N-H82]EDQ99868.1 predicted protein [Laccaria bicolor S238N-H82]|eukprot:XP_001889411.1 predicted protein [Laccaria bicolor S238N-H82]